MGLGPISQLGDPVPYQTSPCHKHGSHAPYPLVTGSVQQRGGSENELMKFEFSYFQVLARWSMFGEAYMTSRDESDFSLPDPHVHE